MLWAIRPVFRLSFGLSTEQSVMTTIQITISDTLAKEAAAEGLLEPGAFEAILRERLAAIRVGKMQAARQKMVSAAVPPMAAKEIEAEIQAYRAERRRAAGA
jgi:hypothetical protein